MSTVQSSAVLICCGLEQETLSSLLQSTHLVNEYQMEHHQEGCLLRVLNSPKKILLYNEHILGVNFGEYGIVYSFILRFFYDFCPFLILMGV